MESEEEKWEPPSSSCSVVHHPPGPAPDGPLHLPRPAVTPVPVAGPASVSTTPRYVPVKSFLGCVSSVGACPVGVWSHPPVPVADRPRVLSFTVKGPKWNPVPNTEVETPVFRWGVKTDSGRRNSSTLLTPEAPHFSRNPLWVCVFRRDTLRWTSFADPVRVGLCLPPNPTDPPAHESPRPKETPLLLLDCT